MQQLILPGVTIAFGLYIFCLGCGLKFLPPKGLRGRVWLAVLGVLVLLWGGSSMIAASVGPHYPAEFIARQLREQIHPPAKLDETTRIDDVTARENTVVYTMSFTVQSTDLKAMEQNVRNDMKGNACGSPDYEALFKLQGSVQIVFKDINGNVVDTLTIAPADCGIAAP